MEQDDSGFTHDDHRVSSAHFIIDSLLTKTLQAAFIFGQDDETDRASRPAKRRKISGKAASARSRLGTHPQPGSEFVPLFHGAENHEFVKLRQALFADAWTEIDARIQVRQSQSEVGSSKSSRVDFFVLRSMF